MGIDKYLIETENLQKERNRTLNINASIHLFLKRVASHYNTSMSTLVSNILLEWKNKYEDDITADMINKLKEK